MLSDVMVSLLGDALGAPVGVDVGTSVDGR